MDKIDVLTRINQTIREGSVNFINKGTLKLNEQDIKAQGLLL